MGGLTVSDFDAAGTLDGTELIGLVKNGLNKRTTSGAFLNTSIGGNTISMGLATSIPALTLATGAAATTNLFHTSGYASVADGGEAWYRRMTVGEAVELGEKTSVDGVRLALARVQRITPQMFGAVANGSTNDSAAFVAAIAWLKSIAVNVNGITYEASSRLFVPAGHYYMGTTTLDITHTLIINGEGSGFNGPSPASKLRWAAGATGIRIQAHNTSGAGTVDSPTHFSGSGTIICGLGLLGGYTATNAEFHGIHAKARFKLQDCIIDSFQGDGIYLNATASSGTATEGNVNGSQIENSTIRACRNGFRIDSTSGGGADANAIIISGVDFASNRAWAVDDGGFLGNTYIECEAASNTSGAYRTTNANATHAFINCYAEGGQPASAFNGTTLVVGGQHGNGAPTGAYIHASSGTVAAPIWTATTKNVTPRIECGATAQTVQFDSAGTNFHDSYTDNNLASWAPYALRASSLDFRISGTSIWTVDSTGILLASGKVLKINGVTMIDGTGLAVNKLVNAAAASIVGATAAGAHADLTPSQGRTVLGLGTGALVNIAVGTSAPGSPATNDLWVDTN